jgi:hypothetical protein
MKRILSVLPLLVAGMVLAQSTQTRPASGPASGPADRPPAPPAVSRPAPPVHERVKIDLPEGALAYHFNGGNNDFPGFKTIHESSQSTEGDGWVGLVDDEVGVSGNARYWPYGLMEAYLWTSPELPKEIECRIKVPSGDYLAWMIAGPLIRPDIKVPNFILKLNDTVLSDEHCTPETFNSEKHLFRFMWTQYSERPHFVYDAYISRMFPMVKTQVKVTDGVLSLKVQNQILGAMILLPADRKADFDKMDSALRQACMEEFESRVGLPAQTKPVKGPDDGAMVLYAPDWADDCMPWSAPPVEKRKDPLKLRAAGVAGAKGVLRLNVVPFEDLGECSLLLAELKGPAGTLPSTIFSGGFKNYSVMGVDPKGKNGARMLSRDDWYRADITETLILPSLKLNMEKGITQSFWLLADIPADAKAGVYAGNFAFKTADGKSTPVPVEVEVYPFQLEKALPISFGLYGTGVDPPLVDDATCLKLLDQRLKFLRQMGFTGVELPMPQVKGLQAGGKVDLDMTVLEDVVRLAKQDGIGQIPQQTSLVASYFGIGRPIGARLIAKAADAAGKPIKDPQALIDGKPDRALELQQPGFEDYFLDAARQFKALLDKHQLPVVLNVVDEPRENYINPWNRNYDACVKYLTMLRKVPGLTLAMNPMEDVDHYKQRDYLGFLDYVDVLSTHAWPKSARFIADTPKKGKTLWIYNVGMDRFSWGAYDWKIKTKGRWEWHLCFPSEWVWEYYAGQEWFNPFCEMGGVGPAAPYAKYPGGMLYGSKMLEMLEGMNDYAYFYTLSKAIEAADHKPGAQLSPTRDPDAEAAEKFLADLEAKVPQFPPVRGLAAGPQVGKGLDVDVARNVDEWRTQIAEHLKKLKK